MVRGREGGYGGERALRARSVYARGIRDTPKTRGPKGPLTLCSISGLGVATRAYPSRDHRD